MTRSGALLARLVGVAALAIVVVACPAAAQEPLRVAVSPFGGRGARPVQREVERVVRDGAELADPTEAARAARQAGVRGVEADGVGVLAASLDVALIVQGTVAGSRRAPELTLVIRGAEGQQLARGTVTYRGRRARDDFDGEVRALLDEARAGLTPRARREPEPLAPPEVRAVPDPAPVGPDDGLAVASVWIGAAVRTRDVDIELAGGGTRRYASGGYPEIVLGFELRPFASESHLGRGLFVNGGFGHSIGLASEVTDTSTSVPTNFVRLAVGAGWLAPLGDAAELGVGLSFLYDGYHLAPNVVLPTAEYFVLRPAARGRIRLAGETVVLDLEVAYRGVLGIGELATAFGDRSGAHGVDVGVEIGGNLLRAVGLGFTWAVRFDWAGYFFDFGGSAADALGTSGTESALRFTAVVGWSFR